ncbi:MAG: dUTP diphosphatase [Thermoplasmata archaeon]|nr:dUTP diphosphatase [Thermoplasmata archaeon]MCI4341707.1 dUTP diphosphatase [Thermoplasmata archaeon]
MPGEARTVVVERLPEFPSVPLPVRSTPGAACFDLHAATGATLRRGEVTRVRTGLRMRAPPGTFLEVRPRSGLATRGVAMANAPGTIDRDYAGEVQVPLTYLFEGVFEIKAGDRIGQIRLVEDHPVEFGLGSVETVPGRVGGFGSTGR